MNPNKRAERIVKEYEDKNDLIPGYSVEEVLIGLERETKVLEKENLALKARAEKAEAKLAGYERRPNCETCAVSDCPTCGQQGLPFCSKYKPNRKQRGKHFPDKPAVKVFSEVREKTAPLLEAFNKARQEYELVSNQAWKEYGLAVAKCEDIPVEVRAAAEYSKQQEDDDYNSETHFLAGVKWQKAWGGLDGDSPPITAANGSNKKEVLP
jgi:hypothetical protein